jgi:hypothetical protein
MITVIGGNGITLKRLMLQLGFHKTERVIDRASITGVFNASFTTAQMYERVPEWVYHLPMINKKLVSNKLTALQNMSMAGMEENIPEFSLEPRQEGNWISKPYASQAGQGIERYVNGMRVPMGKYLQKDVKKFREFRAHVGLWLDNPVFTIQEKKPKPELWDATYPEGDHEYEWPLHNEAMRGFLPVTWNIESGFYFKRVTTPENRAEKVDRFPLIKRIEQVGIKAVKALGYQYGAVDILMSYDRNLYVVEVNSHPAIKNPTSVDIYNEALRPLQGISAQEFRALVGVDYVAGTSVVTLRRTTNV